MIDYAIITTRAAGLWTRDAGSWAHDADGRPVDLWSPAALTFNRAGAILRAIEMTVGRGRSTSRQFSTVERRLDRLPVRAVETVPRTNTGRAAWHGAIAARFARHGWPNIAAGHARIAAHSALIYLDAIAECERLDRQRRRRRDTACLDCERSNGPGSPCECDE